MYSGDYYSAIVMGASGGIGTALCHALHSDPRCEQLIALSRSADGLDLTDETSIANHAVTLSPYKGKIDLIINATGALEIDNHGPEKSFADITTDNLTKAFATNATASALFLKRFMPLLKTSSRAVFATLSARVGSIGDNTLGGWMGYRASKAALNQIVRCAAIEQNRRNAESIIIALHPGTIKTPLTEQYAKGRYTHTPEECAKNLLEVMASLKPEHNGGFFDYAGNEIAW